MKSAKSKKKKTGSWIKPWYWLILAALVLGIVILCIPEATETPEGKYLLMDGDAPYKYLTAREDTLLEGSYMEPTVYSLSQSKWKKAPFSQEEWENMADPYGMGARKPVPAAIDGCRYLDLGTVIFDKTVETAEGEKVLRDCQLHTFLLEQEGQFYFCKIEIPSPQEDGVPAARAWRMVVQGSEQDPVAAAFRELDSLVEQLLETAPQNSREAVLAAVEENEPLFQQIYDHSYVVKYIAHMFVEKGVSDTRETFMTVLLEEVMDRRNEQLLMPLEEDGYTTSFLSFIESAQRLYTEKGYTYMLTNYPVTLAMVLYLTNQ